MSDTVPLAELATTVILLLYMRQIIMNAGFIQSNNVHIHYSDDLWLRILAKT